MAGAGVVLFLPQFCFPAIAVCGTQEEWLRRNARLSCECPKPQGAMIFSRSALC